MTLESIKFETLNFDYTHDFIILRFDAYSLIHLQLCIKKVQNYFKVASVRFYFLIGFLKVFKDQYSQNLSKTVDKI